MKAVNSFFLLAVLAIITLFGTATTTNIYAQDTEIKKIRVKPKSAPDTNTKASSSNNKRNNPGKPLLTGNKVFIGGGVYTSTDLNSFVIDANPYLGYRVSNKTTVGVGPVYQYRQTNTPVHIYGLRAFGRHDIVPGIWLEADYEYMNVPVGDNQRTSTSRLPVGAGMSKSIGGMNFNGAVLYDLLYNKDRSPYGSPFVIRGGVTFGGGFNFGS